ncbi:MAG TPA: hypothetical protein VNN62_18820 [Methylomirabilota bacterium]|nr:hypothetical protein [Methylomirabilota bacterium]
MASTANVTHAETLQLVSRLLEVGNVDTVYRDLYLQRARELFAGELSRADYVRLRHGQVEIDNLLRQSRVAVERGEWAKVKELAGRMRTLRQQVEEKRSLLKLGEEIYDVADIPLDPFSPGFQTLFARSGHALVRIREQVLGRLATLAQEDQAWREFYTGRRAAFQALSLAALESIPSPVRPGQIQRAALQALDNGDVDQLERLSQEMLALQGALQDASPALQSTHPAERNFSCVFSAQTLACARRLGLVPAQAVSCDEFSDYLRCGCAWQATFPDQPLTARQTRRQDRTCGHGCPLDIPAALKETFDLLIVHPFVNSGGARYLPPFAAEDVLVEDFPEETGETPGLALLSALGLQRRTAVSRVEIERAVLEHGSRIIEGLGLEPREFRLLCIPFDLYCRLGPSRGWGQQQRWTHFDGYQVLKEGRLRALVGGDVRSGGVHDLTSIDRADEREGVVIRFAVVQRARLRAW